MEWIWLHLVTEEVYGGDGSGFYGWGYGANSGPGGGSSGYINTSKIEKASMYGFDECTLYHVRCYFKSFMKFYDNIIY